MLELVDKTAQLGNEQMKNVHLEDDGLLHCNFCGGAREFVMTDDKCENEWIRQKFSGKKYPIVCSCQDPANSLESKESAKRQFAAKVLENRTIGLSESGYKHYTMKRDDRKNEKVSASVQRYIDSWQDNKSKNKGILFYGPIGTGKTFYAAAIANSVLDIGEKVRMLPLSSMIDACIGSYGEGKKNVMEWVRSCDLLIIDDFGTQRKTDTVYEIVYDIIDARYQAKKPLIITTNMKLEDMRKADDRSARMYDRINEMCVPFPVAGESRRKNPHEQEVFRMYEELSQ